MIHTCYQTLEDNHKPGYYEQNGPHKCTSDVAWLGHGYYFWDRDLRTAHRWGEKYREYLIFEGKITYDETVFDIYGYSQHKEDMYQWANELKKKNPKLNEKTLTVANVIEYAKRKANFNLKYNAIRAVDYPEEQMFIIFAINKREGTYVGRERVQYCLINKKNLDLQTFVAIYPENYNEF